MRSMERRARGTERAKLHWATLGGLALLSTLGCIASESAARTAPAPVYNPRTRELLRLDWDLNGDGRIDQRTYVVGTTPLRSESDSDGDGRIDQWEYVTPTGAIAHVGTSSANDGLEDTWVWPPNAAGEVRIERAQYRDRIVDRREYYRADALVRAEEDANRDGHVDKWETWAGGVLRLTAFDTSFAGGAANRRLVYDEAGRFAYVEADTDGDGRFERVNTPEAPAR